MKTIGKTFILMLVISLIFGIMYIPGALADDRVYYLEDAAGAFSQNITKGKVVVEAEIPAATAVTIVLKNANGTERINISVSAEGVVTQTYANANNIKLAANNSTDTKTFTSEGFDLMLIPDVDRGGYAFIVDGEIYKSNIMMKYAEGDVATDLASVELTGITGVDVYSMNTEDRDAYETLFTNFFEAEKFTDDFEWGTDYLTVSNAITFTPAVGDAQVNNNISYVYKPGTALSVGRFSDGTNCTYYYKLARTADITASTVINATIEQDEDHGQVFKYDVKNGKSNRGPFFRTGKIYNDRFAVIEYEFKIDEGAISNYINPFTDTKDGRWQVAVANYRHYVNYYEPVGGAKKYASILYKDYIDADKLDNGNLSGWHKVTYLVDNIRGVYDYFIDDILIATDVARVSVDTSLLEGSVSAIMMGQSSGDATYYIDDFKMYSVTDKTAADMVITGMDNFIDDGVFAEERLASNKTLSLPCAELSGLRAKDHQNYQFVDGSGAVLLESNDTKAVSYSFVPDAGNYKSDEFTLKDEPAAFTVHSDYIQDGTVDFDEVYAYTDGKLTKMTAYTLGGASLSVGSRVAGKYQDNKGVLTVTVNKGDVTLTKNYNIAFKRNLTESLVPGLEVGAINFEKPTVAQVTAADQQTKHQTHIINYGDAKVVRNIIALYKADGSLYKIATTSKNFAKGADASSWLTFTWSEADITAMAGGTIKGFLWVDGVLTPITVTSTN